MWPILNFLLLYINLWFCILIFLMWIILMEHSLLYGAWPTIWSTAYCMEHELLYGARPTVWSRGDCMEHGLLYEARPTARSTASVWSTAFCLIVNSDAAQELELLKNRILESCRRHIPMKRITINMDQQWRQTDHRETSESLWCKKKEQRWRNQCWILHC